MLQAPSYPVMFYNKFLFGLSTVLAQSLISKPKTSNTKDVLKILIFFKTYYNQQEVKKLKSASCKQDVFVDGNFSKIRQINQYASLEQEVGDHHWWAVERGERVKPGH